MAKLYGIGALIEECVDMETGEIIDRKKLESLQMEKREKVRNIACWIKNLRSDAVAPGKCRVRQATKEELDELDKPLGPVDKSILAPNGGAKGIYALQEPHFRMPRNPAREEAEAKERAKKKPPSGRACAHFKRCNNVTTERYKRYRWKANT